MRSIRRVALLLLLAGLVAAWTLGLGDLASWPLLARHFAWLRAETLARPVLAPVAFVLLYAATTALSIPVGALFSVLGGALFGAVAGAACAVLGATAGAVLLFLAARSALGAPLRARAGPFLARLRPGLERDGFSYLLALRLIPLVPFWLANLAPALVGMRLPPFALATLIGVVPVTFVFASIGDGLGDALQDGRAPDLSVVFGPRVLLPLLAMATLSLLPVLWRRWRRSDA